MPSLHESGPRQDTSPPQEDGVPSLHHAGNSERVATRSFDAFTSARIDLDHLELIEINCSKTEWAYLNWERVFPQAQPRG